MSLSIMPVIDIGGSAREIGRQTGEHFREEIASNIEANYLTTNWYEKDHHTWNVRLPLTMQVMARELPLIYEEIQGMAEGAGQSVERIAAINAPFYSNELDDNCTNIVFAKGPDGPIWGKNNDGITFDDGMPIYLRRVHPEQGIPYLAFGFAGWLGFGDGMNAEGLAMGHSSVGSRLQQSDQHVPVRMWAHLGMMTCRNTQDFVSHMASRPHRGKGYAWVVVDKGGDACSLEVPCPTTQVRRGTHSDGHVNCVNYYQLPHLAEADRRTPDAKCHAHARRKMLDRKLTEAGPYDESRMADLLRYHADPGVCRHGGKDKSVTNYSALALPAKGILRHYLGRPCEGEYGEVSI